ncbi:glycoside hydrolase family 25 protein [Chryseobacterium sp. A321]
MAKKKNPKSKSRSLHSRRKHRRHARSKILLMLFASLLLGTGYMLKEKITLYVVTYLRPKEHKLLKNKPSEQQRIERITAHYADKTFGIDLSHYQNPKDIQWDSLSIGHGTIPIDFIILRASMGTSGKDEKFEEFWKSAGKQNKLRGAYHFYRPDEDPIKQAAQFLESVQLAKGDLAPVLDIEKAPRKISKKNLKKNLQLFLDIVQERYQVKPILYTYYHYYNEYLAQDFSSYPVWLANYNDVLQPHESHSWSMWQFTENGIINGINTKVDLNVYNGSLGSMKELTIP